MTLSDSFIKKVIRPKDDKENEDMITREFRGIEAVAQFEETEEIEQVNGNGGDK